jgi:hypothetical protein
MLEMDERHETAPGEAQSRQDRVLEESAIARGSRRQLIVE